MDGSRHICSSSIQDGVGYLLGDLSGPLGFTIEPLFPPSIHDSNLDNHPESLASGIVADTCTDMVCLSEGALYPPNPTENEESHPGGRVGGTCVQNLTFRVA